MKAKKGGMSENIPPFPITKGFAILLFTIDNARRRVPVLNLKDSIEINVTPEEVEEWLVNIDKHYQSWHPDHVKWVNLDGSLGEGRSFYYEEYLHGRLYKSRCRITRSTRNNGATLEFVGLSVLDRILGVCGSFIVEPKGSGSYVTATISLRFRRLIQLLAGGIVRDLERHMKEEGESLKKILEARAVE